jgi:hypothetical protein
VHGSNARFGSITAATADSDRVRFTPKSYHGCLRLAYTEQQVKGHGQPAIAFTPYSTVLGSAELDRSRFRRGRRNGMRG